MTSRRQFLGQSFALGVGSFFLDPFRAVTEGIADSLILRAQAEASNNTPSRLYVNVQMSGAPIRYQFDHFLRTSVQDLSLENVAATGKVNAMTCDALSIGANGLATPIMRPFTYRGVLVPHLWSQSVTTSRVANRPLADLLNHMLVVRGFGSGLDGHQFNLVGQQNPIAGVSTLNALAAENTTSVFDSVQYPSRGLVGVFFSSQSKSQIVVTGSSPLNTLMEGFSAPGNKLAVNLKEKHKEAMELAQARLKSFSRSESRGSKIVAQQLTNASEMMARGLGNLSGYYTDARNRYQSVMESSLRATGIPFISDKAIISDESPIWTVGAGEPFILSKERDARAILTEASLASFAEGLAVTEYLFKEGLASSADLSVSGLRALSLLKKAEKTAISFALSHDMHATGAGAAILLMNAFYRALSAGILEFMDRLGTDLWEKTVLQVQGDFGRTARSNGSGSDHGFNQMVTSVFSGAFNNGPIVVGNIRRGGHNANYAGTQGIAAPIAGYNQTGMPSPTMAASTVTTLLETRHNPYANTAAPLVSLTNGTLKALIPGKIVA